MLPHGRYLFLPILGAWISFAPALAFEDREFCSAAQQFAFAAEQDVGVWVDRITRNAGMVVSCDRKVVEFRHFTYSNSASMDAAWKQRKATEWNGTRCSSQLWTDAIRNNWKIVLSVTAADGGQVRLNAQCD